MNNQDFYNICIKHFGFLIEEYSFHIVKSENFVTLFENENIFLKVVFDSQRSYEVDVYLGEVNSLTRDYVTSYDLRGLIELVDGHEESVYKVIQITNLNDLDKFIKILASIANKYIEQLILKSEDYFSKLSSLRICKEEEYAEKTQLARIRKSVHHAWGNKDYQSVVNLLGSIKK